jgi:hypothetical protein
MLAFLFTPILHKEYSYMNALVKYPQQADSHLLLKRAITLKAQKKHAAAISNLLLAS